MPTTTGYGEIRERLAVGRAAKRTYYVFVPGYRITAEVRDAPSTKHARTSFLDFLVRQRRIPWAQRSKVRRRMKVVKVKPGEIPASVVLDYDMPEPYTELPIQEAPYTEDIIGELEREEEVRTEIPEEREPVPQPVTRPGMPYVPRPVAPMRQLNILGSPIMGASRR